MKTAHYQMKKVRTWWWTFWRVFKARDFRGFHHVNFSSLANAFVSITVFSLNFVVRVSFAIFGSKVPELLWRSLFPFWMAIGTRQLSDSFKVLPICSKFTSNIFDRKTWYYWQNLVFYNLFYFIINRKRLIMRVFPKFTLITKKRPLKVTSTTFLFR